jgi:ABC-2 type transport system permease protein
VLPAGHLYLALVGAGFQRQTSYRLALAAGLATNAFFGVVRTAVFLALYRERDQVAGLDVADALTYVWVLEGMFAVVWAPWIWELAEAIRSGEFVVELLRSGDPYLRLAAFDLGRTLSVLVTRTAPVVAVASLVLPLRLPGTLGGLALLAVSLVLAAVVSFQFRFLFASAAFWTPDYRSMFLLVFPVLWLVSGFVIPVDFFPGPLRALVDWSPLIPLVMAPVRVATGASAGEAVTGQVAEVLLLFGLAFSGQGLALVFGDTLEADEVSRLVRRGTFDQVLTRPVSPLGWVVASYVDTRFLGRLLAGTATVLWAADRAGVAWTAGRAGLAVLAVAGAAAIVFGVLLAAAGFTFVTVQGSEAVNVLIYGGQYLASYPMQIYGSALRFVFVWLVPFGLAIYVPALGILGRQGPSGLPAWLAWLTAPAAGTFLAAGGLAWRAGIRHYVGTGS